MESGGDGAALEPLRKQIDALHIGSVEFHFVGPKVSVKVVESRLLRRDD